MRLKMDLNELKEQIDTQSQPGDFYCSKEIASDICISKIEATLNARLPHSYKWFLATYGRGGLHGTEIFGCRPTEEVPEVVTETLRYRRDYNATGFNDSFVAIERFEDAVFCLDTARFENEECPVILFNVFEGEIEREYPNFICYLEDSFRLGEG